MVDLWALWSRMARRDGRLTIIYFSGLGGAIVGAKLSFLFAEGWAYRDDWLALMTGRSITGALLGGYAAVETSKHILRYARATGDLFAIVVPVGIALPARWPMAAPKPGARCIMSSPRWMMVQ